MCCTQRTCHNIFYALVDVTRSGMKTRQNWPDLSRRRPDPISYRDHEMCTQLRYHTDTPLDLLLSLSALCSCSAYWLVCANICVFVLSFVLCPVLLGVTRPLTRCFFFFSFGCLDVCFAACIGCFCAASMYIYTHAHMPHVVSDIHTSYSLSIASCSHKVEPQGWCSDARNCLIYTHMSRKICVKNITKTLFLSTSERCIGIS